MKKTQLIVLGLSCLILMSCATNSKSRWLTIGVAAPIGAGVGALSAPPTEKPEMHAFAWSSVFVAIAAIIGNYHFSDDEELKNLRTQVRNFEKASLPKLIDKGQGYLKHPFLGETKLKNWKLYKIDKWVEEDENTRIHQDLMFKVAPIEDDSTKKKIEKEDKSD